MAHICHDRKAVFLCNPGTGSTAMEHVLEQQFGWTEVGTKHAGYQQLQKQTGMDLSDYFVFTTVRNPFDFFASEYSRFRNRWARMLEEDPTSWIHRNRSVKRRIAIAVAGDFPRFVAFYFENGENTRGRWRREYWGRASFVMRTETLQLDFNNVARLLGYAAPVPLPKVNVTPGAERLHRHELFTPELVEYVNGQCAPYLELFGYRFESPG